VPKDGRIRGCFKSKDVRKSTSFGNTVKHLNTAACQLSNNTEYYFVLRVDNCTAGLRQRRLSVYDVTVLDALSAAAAAATISGDKIRVLGPREGSTYFIHESCNDWRVFLFQFHPLVLCTKRLLAECSAMQYSHLVTRLDSLGICNVASQEEREGASTVSHKKAW